MQNPLDHFLSDLANKIQTAKEYKDIIKDSQNVDVNKNVFEGFMLGVAETIKKELKDQLPETTQIEAVSSIAYQQKDPEPQEDPLAKFVNTLANTISANKNKPIEQEKQDEDEEKKVEDEPAPEPQQDSFEKFIGNLKDIIQKTPKETPVLSSPIVHKKDKPKAGVKDYVKELVKNPKDENEEKPKNKSDLIKDLVRKFVEGEIKGFKDEISQKFNQVGAAYGGGGGTNAVQYANGGTMNGDLNVNGHILSGGRDISNFFGNGGGGGTQTLFFNSSNADLSISGGNTVSLSALSGGGSGPTDRLVNGSYQVVLSSNGAVTFPDNLTIDNSTISNLNMIDIGSGDTLTAGSQIEVLSSQTAITAGVTNTLGSSFLAYQGRVTVDGYKAVVAHQSINSFDGGSSSLTSQNQIEVNPTNVLVGRKVINIVDGNSLSAFSGWTFDVGYGSLTFPDNTTQTTAFTGNPDSSNWNSNYTTTNNNSSNWSLAYTNLIYNSAAYLSGFNSTAITQNSANWNTAYTNLVYNSTAYLSAYDMSLVNSNSANWNSVYSNVNSNSANYALTNTNVTFQNNVTIQGNLTALGTSTFKNTIFTTTSALSVINTGPGPALYVYQAAGPYDVASFYDGDGVEVLHVGNANPGGNGFVGINESFPTVELSVRGAISASKTITALGGNSNQWNTAYTNLIYNSASYLTGASLNYVNTNFVKISGDTMTGTLSVGSGGNLFSPSFATFVKNSSYVALSSTLTDNSLYFNSKATFASPGGFIIKGHSPDYSTSIQNLPGKGTYGMWLQNVDNMDPGTTFVSDGRAQVTHAMSFRAGIDNFTAGSDHNHVQWQGAPSNNTQAWQMTNGGSTSVYGYGSNTYSQRFLVHTLPQYQISTTIAATSGYFDTRNANLVTNTDKVSGVVILLDTTFGAGNYNLITPGSVVGVTLNPGLVGLAAVIYNSQCTQVSSNGGSLSAFQFDFFIGSGSNWVPAQKGIQAVNLQSRTNGGNPGVSLITSQVGSNPSTQYVGITGCYRNMTKHALARFSTSSILSGFKPGSPLTLWIPTAMPSTSPIGTGFITSDKISTFAQGTFPTGVRTGYFDAYVINVSGADMEFALCNLMDSYGFENRFWPISAAGNAGWLLYGGTQDTVHRPTFGTTGFYFEREPWYFADPYNYLSGGMVKCVGLGNSEVYGDFSYGLGYRGAVLGKKSGTFAGDYNAVYSDNSVALGGEGLISLSSTPYQAVVGKYNNPNNNALFVVGAGGGDTNRVNILEVNNNSLTVTGSLSASGTMFASGGNSNQWNNAYTNLVYNSASYLSGFNSTAITQNSANWNSVYSTVNTNSGNYILDGGNTKGANISIGTNDNYNLTLEINNSSKLLLTSDTLSGNSIKTSFGAGSATGLYSFAEGLSTLASGNYSHAEGYLTIASGLMSHAEGNRTQATDNYAHAEGESTRATGYASHAEGDSCIASGTRSHAEGSSTTARGATSHAAGSYAEAAHDRTWIWKGSTNTNVISTTRTDQFLVSASGGIFFPSNVGIGTDNNTNGLTVVGNTSATGIVYADGGDSNNWNSNYSTTQSNSANWILDGGNTKANDINIGTNDNYNLFLETNNSKNFVITRVGNVGIGTPVTTIANNQDLIGYNFFSLINSSASTASPSLGVTSIAAGLMTRSAGIGAFVSTAGWGSQNYTIGAASVATAIANNEYYTIPIYSTQNTTIIISSLASFIVDRSNNGPSSIGFLYGTSSNPLLANTIAIATVAATPSDIIPTVNQALTANPITITPGTSGYIFLVPYGAGTNTGNLRFISNYPLGNANDLSFQGTITDEPYNKLTVNGAISSNNIITVANGNSNQWNSNWTTTNANSANWNNAYTNLIYNSTAYLSGFNSTAITQNSANWNTAYTNLVYNSTAYLSAYDMSLINANSANWSSVYTSFNSNSAKYDSNYTTTNSNSAAWSNWRSISANYALGSQYVKLSGDDMTGLLTNSVGISSFSLSARFIDLVHIPANDGTNPVLRIGEYDTASGNQGFSGMYMSYNETTNAFGISAQFSPNAGVPAISIDRNANTSIRSLYAGPLDFAYTGSFTSLSSISGMFVDPVRGNAGFATFDPIAPLDVRGTMVRVASARTMTAPSNLKVQSNYAYVLNYTSGSLQVFDVSYTSTLSTVSAGAGTNPYGLYVNGEHAYVVTSNGSSSQLLIFKLAAGTPIMISATTIGWGTFNATDVYVQGNYAYILGSNSSGPSAGRFTVWNISNPANPRMIINYSSAGISPRGLLVQDRYAYYITSSFGSLNLYRVDVSDVANGNLPAPISVYGTTGNFYSFTVRGNYAYMEISDTIRILDLTRLNVVSTTTITTIPLSWNGEMVLQGNYLYVMRFSLLFKIDISNPVAPFIVQILSVSTGSTTYLNCLQIQGRYAYVLDQTTGLNSIRIIDLGGAYIQQLQTGGIKTDKLYVAQNSILGNDLDVSGGAGFGQGFKSYKDSSIQGALTLTTLSGASAVNYFSVLTGFNSTLFMVNTAGNVGINTGYPNEKLTVVGNISATGDISATGNITSGVLTVTNLANISGVVTLGNSSNVSTLQINGYANKGGVGYHDFASVTNTYGSATTPSKFFRLNSSGGLEIINSAYTANLLQITNDGAINVYGANAAVVSNNDALSGYIGFNNNNSQIYDDGNTHIHSRGSGNAMWINTNNGQLNLLVQSPVSGGSVGTGVAIGTGTLNGYVSINSSRNTAITQPYGYLISSGAGTTAGTSPNPYSLTCSSRIQCPEFDASSDERLKENIVPITLNDALNFVKGVSAVTFNWKDKENPGKKSGYIAQQVMRSGFDHMISVVGNIDLQEKIDADGFVSPASAALVMNYDQVIPYHSTVIKNLLERIEQLELEIKNLKK